MLKSIKIRRIVSQNIFNKNLVAIHEIKPVLTLNKPIYVGMYILDLSRFLMYDFNFNDIKDIYGKIAKLLVTDTGNLLYEIEVDHVFEDFYKDNNKFDFSEYRRDSWFHDDTDKRSDW